jgi:general secretion pathway protein E
MMNEALAIKTGSSSSAVPGTVAEAEAGLAQGLLATGALSEQELQRARRLQRDQGGGEPLWTMLANLGLVPERQLAEWLAEHLALELVDEAVLEPLEPLPAGVSEKFLASRSAMVLEEDDRRLLLAVVDPFDDYLCEALALATGKRIERCLAVRPELEAALERVRSGSGPDTPDAGGEIEYEADAERLKELASEAPVVRLVGQLLQRAAEARASDIHVEPFEGRLRIRYRIDGLLREVDSRPIELAPAVTSRIKIMASLNIAERRLPQDGRFKARALGRSIDLRVSTVPTLYGESVVIRLLNSEGVSLDFAALGFEPQLAEQLVELLAQPHGIILVTGPTGSGKTTTLYAGLHHLNSSERKILTVEDPVEYNLEGINQIQVKPQIGLTFANALRSIVRQDPDVIMIGEMRDRETADIAVQSALTGHLVLSTLHTNDAAGSVTRLQDMGVENYLLTSTLLGILAQRLVRRICPGCIEPSPPSPELARRWGLEELAAQACHGAGCTRCSGTGYLGRVSIGELLVFDEPLRRAVLEGVDAGNLAALARKAGMRTLFADGMLKVAAGETTIDEVLRVTRDA